MKLNKFKCPECGKKVFIIDDGEHVSDTDMVECPLLAPSWEEAALWEKHPYYNVVCESGHESIVFTKPAKIVDIDTFHKIRDDQEEIYLEKNLLKKLPGSHGEVYLLVDYKTSKMVGMFLYKGKAEEEAEKLNDWSKKFPSRFKVIDYTISFISPDVKVNILLKGSEIGRHNSKE